MLLRGVTPIQQHLHPSIDLTSLNARRISFQLRSKLEENEYMLMELCESLPEQDLYSFLAFPDENGNLLPSNKSIPILLQKHNYSMNRDSSVAQLELMEWIRGLSWNERRRLYGNRTVGYIDVENLLLPRPDTYREGDKIHASFTTNEKYQSPLLSLIEQSVM